MASDLVASTRVVSSVTPNTLIIVLAGDLMKMGVAGGQFGCRAAAALHQGGSPCFAATHLQKGPLRRPGIGCIPGTETQGGNDSTAAAQSRHAQVIRLNAHQVGSRCVKASAVLCCAVLCLCGPARQSPTR